MDELFESATAGELRDSISDGSYRYCNNKQCSYLKDTEILTRRSAWNRPPQTLIRHIRLAMDESCNLRCPSCRVDPILHTSGLQFDMRKKLVDKVLDYIDKRIKKKNSLRENCAVAKANVESGLWTVSNLHNSVNATPRSTPARA